MPPFTLPKIRYIIFMVAENIEMPDAMETIFQSALTFGKNGGVSVIYSKKINFVLSCECLLTYLLLIDIVQTEIAIR